MTRERRLSDAEAAREYGVRDARAFVGRAATEEGAIDLAHHIDVVDEAGTFISKIMFAEVGQLAIAGRPVV